MNIAVEKRPGGLAVFVPELLAARAGLREGGRAEIEWADNRLVIRLGGESALAAMLAQITPENLHDEWAVGPPSGVEML